MSGLPPNWEWDYDGARWFYRYKPNGHIQFHFPKEGDEFPDFVDALSPVPELAPEEKLESQQQVKRRTGCDNDARSKMRATGGPLGDFGMGRSGFGGPRTNDDDDGDGFFYQPENFMYLGPGVYNDISPLADEDERDEIPRDRHRPKPREEKKDKLVGDATSDRIGVSPLQSEANTPSVVNSVLSRDAVVPAPVAEEPTPEPILAVTTQDLPRPTHPVIPSPGVPLLDSVEMPRQDPPPATQQPAWDPVGIVAEMPTEHTATAHIEIHPDPVEMADNTVLAPIETRVMDFGIAELPERNSPSELKPPAVSSTHDMLHQTTMTDQALFGATFGTGSRPQSLSAASSSPLATPASHNSAIVDRPTAARPPTEPATTPQSPSSTQAHVDGAFSIKRKPSNTSARQGKYQPYVPGVITNVAAEKKEADTESPRREHRNSLAREASLMMGSRQTFETSGMPSVLQPPKVPPKHPLNGSQASPQMFGIPNQPNPPRVPEKRPENGVTSALQTPGAAQGPLQHVPSVLKPARGYPQSLSQQLSSLENGAAQGQDVVQRRTPPPAPKPGYLQSVASIASPTTASQYTAFQPGLPRKQEIHGGQLYAMPQAGQIPHSLTPAPAQQPSMGPRPGMHRIVTAPAQSPLDHPSLAIRSPLQGTPKVAQGTSTPALPQFLQRPQAQGDTYQDLSQAPPPQAATRARARSDAPRGPAPLISGHHPGGPETVDMPSIEPSTAPYRASRPHSVVGTTSAYQPPRMARPDPSPLPDRDRPRQTSYASSEVSSLGPPTGSQSSGLPLESPSPLETGGRRSSSGFFRGGTPYPMASASSPAGQSPAPHVGQNAFVRPAGSRPASFSGPSPTTSQPQAFIIGQAPPAVPGKVPIQSSYGDFQMPSPVPSSNGMVQGPGNAPQSPPTNRRHSVPLQQVVNVATRTAGQEPQIKSNEYQVLSPEQQQSQGHLGQGISRPHSAQPTSSHPRTAGPSILADTQRLPQPPYPVDATQGIAKKSDRPQRPSVVPPSNQSFAPMSPSTPIRTPGHILHPIQEHTEGAHSSRKMPVPTKLQQAQYINHQSPANSPRVSIGSSQYPSSADSPNGQTLERLTNPAVVGFKTQHNTPHQQSMPSPIGPMAGQTYSPIQNNPYQQHSATGTPVKAAAPSQGMYPGPVSPAVRQSVKDKDKGGWLSKIIKGQGKPTVLQKPPPKQQVTSSMPQSPHAPPPPGQDRQRPYPATMTENAGSGGTQEASHTISNRVNSIPSAHAPAPALAMPFAPGPQKVPSSPSRAEIRHPLARQEVQSNPEHITTAVAPQSPQKLDAHYLPISAQGEQRPASVPPRGLSPGPPPSEQMTDNMSDAASISAISVSTVDVSEAQAQPILKPQLVMVEKNPPPQGLDQLPSRVATAQAETQRPTPVMGKGATTQSTADRELTVAPLFSKGETKTTTSRVSEAAVVHDKWAKKPAVDYSGDDWGDDPWDYQ